MSKRITIVGASGGQEALLSDFLIAFYAFENNTEDSHIFNLDAVYTLPNYGAGIIGQGADFQNNNTNRYITSNHPTEFNFTDVNGDIPFCVNMWVRRTGLSNARIFSKRSGGAFDFTSGFLSGSNYDFFFSKYDNSNLSRQQIVQVDGSNFVLNQWYMITYISGGTLNPNDDYLFVNGVDLSTTRFNNDYVGMLNNSTLPIMIGNSTNNSATKIRGTMDNIAIYKGITPTQAQITALYNNGAGLDYNQTLNI